MRVAAVSIYGDDGRVVGDQILACERFHEPLLDGMLGGASVAHAATDFLKRRGEDAVDRVAGGEVGLDLVVSQRRFKECDKIARADNILAQAADQVARSW